MKAIPLLCLALLGTQEPDIDALLKALSGGGDAAAKAEEELIDLGSKAVPRLEQAEKGAAAEPQARLRRILQEIRDFEAGLESREFDRADELVKQLDARASRLRRRLAKATGKAAFVAAVIEKEFGDQLAAPNSYELATYNFERDAREFRVVRNDADFLLTGGALRVRTVTDDRSEIWDLGETPFDAPSIGVPKPQIEARVAKGRVYLLHTDDDDSNAWWKLSVIERKPRQWILVRWEPLPATADLLKLERTPERVLKSGKVRLQVRAGDHGKKPMRVFADGVRGPNVEEVRTKPLDMDTTPDGHDAEVYSEAGLIPVGKVWILRRLHVKGATHEEGTLQIVAQGKVLKSVKKKAGSLEETWTGRIVIRPGEERRVYAEATYYTRCDVTLSGWLCDERLAELESFPELKPDEKKRADGLIAALDGKDPAARARAMKELVEWGPPVLDYLQAAKRPGIDEAVRRINGE